MPNVNIQDKFIVRSSSGGGISAPSNVSISNKSSSGFTVTWNSVASALGYKLDVATDSGFSSFVTGYNGKDVAGTSQAVTGLASNTTYYTRVRAVAASSNSSSVSDTTEVLTLLNPGLLSGLLAFYKLDDTTDASGNGNTLTNNGSVTFSSGKIGNAAVFDGNNSKYLTSTSNLGQITGSGFSLSFWFNKSADMNTYLIDSEIATQQGWFLATNAGGSIWFLAGSGSWSIAKQINPDNLWSVGQWHHVVLSVDSSNNLTYYVDGQLQSTSDSNVSWTAAGLRFGSNAFDANANYDGQIDAVGIWNRALNGTEVSELYNSGSGLE